MVRFTKCSYRRNITTFVAMVYGLHHCQLGDDILMSSCVSQAMVALSSLTSPYAFVSMVWFGITSQWKIISLIVTYKNVLFKMPYIKSDYRNLAVESHPMF